MRKIVLAVPLLAVAAASLGALYARPDLEVVPVDRVITNLERMLAESPTTVEVRVNLARLHALAYATKITEVQTLRTGYPDSPAWAKGQPFFGHGLPHLQRPVEKTTDPAKVERARQHLMRAIEAYREVLKLEPGHPVASIGLGWTLKESGDRSEAVTQLRRAAALGWELDSGDRNTLWIGQRSVTEEAAFYLIELLDPVRDSAEIATLNLRVRELTRRPRMITPIAVPLRAGIPADAMIDPGRLVAFDLDGSGMPRKWTWLSDDAAWLVHDHRGTGRITSALQLFGAVTFWAFWENGYHALRAMDDDGNGEIRGPEREGLSLWHDRNHNGVSEKGEVRSLAEWDIISLSTAFEYDARHQHEIAWSPRGVQFAGGEVRPTYDLAMSSPGAPCWAASPRLDCSKSHMTAAR